jgi:hypothetical protein
MAVQTAPIEPFAPMNQVDAPPPRGWCRLYAYDGSNNVEYEGWAQSLNKDSEFSIAAGTLTSIVDAANTATVTTASAHGLQSGNRVFVLGASDDDLNTAAGYVITVTGATTFTFTTANVTDATYNAVGLRITTRAPRTNDTVWAIRKYYYTTNLVTRSSWAEGQPETQKFAWDSRTTYAYN